MNKYLYIIKTQIIKSMTYEFNVYGNIIMQTIIMITSAYFWKALYRQQNIAADVDAESMLTYIIMSSVLSVLLITNVERRIEMSVEKGTVATDMMKPVNLFGVYFAEDIGSVLALVFQNMLPILLIFMVKLVNDRHLMGRYTNGRLYNAITWVNKKKCKTTLERSPRTEQLYQIIARAENWLRTHGVRTPIIKWETQQWGEIPADFGRKK